MMYWQTKTTHPKSHLKSDSSSFIKRFLWIALICFHFKKEDESVAIFLILFPPDAIFMMDGNATSETMLHFTAFYLYFQYCY